MRRWRIALILIVLFAAVANAATNIAHAPDPPRRQTKKVRPGDVLLPTFFVSTKSPSDMVSCHQDTAPSANQTWRTMIN